MCAEKMPCKDTVRSQPSVNQGERVYEKPTSRLDIKDF